MRLRSVDDPVVAGPTPFHRLWLSVQSYLTAYVGLMAVMAVRMPCHGQRSLPALAPLLASPALRLHGASFLLQVLQHTAAAAGLHGQWRVSCQLAAGLVPCVVLAQLAAAPPATDWVALGVKSC